VSTSTVAEVGRRRPTRILSAAPRTGSILIALRKSSELPPCRVPGVALWGLQAYFGALGAADRTRHSNVAAYVLLQQSWLCPSASSGPD